MRRPLAGIVHPPDLCARRAFGSDVAAPRRWRRNRFDITASYVDWVMVASCEAGEIEWRYLDFFPGRSNFT